jgi:hypothetical protein
LKLSPQKHNHSWWLLGGVLQSGQMADIIIG